MHELALSQSIVDLVVECARKEGVHAVTRVVVEVGVAAGVEPDALRFCFDVVAADTAPSHSLPSAPLGHAQISRPDRWPEYLPLRPRGRRGSG